MRHIYSCFFQLGRDRKYPRMARVLNYTARKHCPAWNVRVEKIRAPMTEETPAMSGRRVLSTNTDKIHAWLGALEALPDGDELVLMDADMMVLRPLDPVWDRAFDMAYTVKRGADRLPINGGFVAVRATERARAFFRRWVALNDWHNDNPAEHQPWRDKYAGANQAALGRLLETGDHPEATLLALDAAEWNACHAPTWATATERARVLHCKSGLRRAIFGHQRETERAVNALAAVWRATELEMDRDAQRFSASR